MSCNDAAELDGYVDHELDPAAARIFREHLEGCASCRDRVDGRVALGRLIRQAPYYTAPDLLPSRISARSTWSSSSRRVLAWAAAAVLVVAAAGGTSLIRSRVVPRDMMAESVVEAHVRSLMADHLFDVESTDQHTVKPWFLGKLDFAPPVADLASAGFPLIGGRLDYIGGHPSAALVYARRKHAINVFVYPAGDGSGPESFRSIRGFHVHQWNRDGMMFWAVSDLNEAELAEFVRVIQAR